MEDMETYECPDCGQTVKDGEPHTEAGREFKRGDRVDYSGFTMFVDWLEGDLMLLANVHGEPCVETTVDDSSLTAVHPA